jgi:hypothetical protein
MIFDKQSLFSDAQAITATAVSTNVIDQGATGTPIGGSVALARDLGAGGPVPIRIQVTEAFATLTSLTVSIQTSDAEDFGSGVVTVGSTAAIAAADLIAGKVFSLQYVPQGTDKRYVRLNYTVAGSDATAGKVTAGIVTGHQTNG